MNMGKKITELTESSAISGGSSYPVSMGDGTGVKQVKHKTLVSQLLSDMEMPYDETMAMLMETDENEVQKIPNLKAISDWIASKITNNLLATEAGFFLDARLGPVIDNRFKTVENKVTQINSDLKRKSIKYIEKNIQLNEITWIVSQNGKYYSPLQLDIPQDAILLGVSMCRWGGLSENDNLFGYLTSNNGECGIASNVNSFYASAYVNLMFTYIT